MKILRLLSHFLDVALFCFIKVAKCFKREFVQSNRIILVHFAHLGDFILWLDSAAQYRDLYPGKKIVLLSYRYCDITDIAKATGYFDEILTVDTGWKKRIQSVIKAFDLQCDTVINVRPSRTLQSDLFAMSVQANRRIAAQADLTMMSSFWRRRSDKAYNQIIPCGGIKTMELIRYAQFVRGLGAASFQASLPVLLETDSGLMPTIPRGYFAIAPGADSKIKCWPSDRFADLCDRIISHMAMFCVILGTHDEIAIQEEIIKKSLFPKKYIALCGKTDLLQLVQVIRQAEFLVACDNGAAHIGPAAGTKTFVFGSGWDKCRFFPYNIEKVLLDTQRLPSDITARMDCLGCGIHPMKRNSICMKNGIMRCIFDITVDDVWDEVITFY